MIRRIWCTAFAAGVLLTSALSARADVATLTCGVFTFDVDLVKGTVFYAGGGVSQVTVNAAVNDRFIEWTNPYFPNQFKQRIDRTTGQFYTWSANQGWQQTGSCQRVGKSLL